MKRFGKSKAAALRRLGARVRWDLAAIETPPANWMRVRHGPDGSRAWDVVVVGAGLSGLSIAFGLRRQGLHNLLLLDQRPRGLEGPWITSARMETLRSPKQLTGPDFGVPSLTFRSWYEAIAGPASWDRLDKISPGDWMDYLRWYRDFLDLPVRNETRLEAIVPAGDFLGLSLRGPNGAHTLYCRRIVLATGIDGCGVPNVPAMVEAALPPKRYAHSAARIDAAMLSGREIGVLGAAASAFDWAVTALDSGARSVTLFARRSELPVTEALAWANFPGFLGAFCELDDLRRWRFMRRFFALQPPPTQEMFDRAASHPRFRMVLDAPWRRVAMEEGRIRVATDGGAWLFDHVLLGTGFRTDLARRPEFSALVDEIALWGDRFAPPPGEEDPELARYPYLGPAFELTEKRPGVAPWLGRVHIFNNGAVPSLGPVCNGVTGLKYGAPKIVSGILKSLFVEDADQHLEGLMNYDHAHFRAHAPLEAHHAAGSQS
jgi:FAD-dependent urate hydroxylase